MDYAKQIGGEKHPIALQKVITLENDCAKGLEKTSKEASER